VAVMPLSKLRCVSGRCCGRSDGEHRGEPSSSSFLQSLVTRGTLPTRHPSAR
jgi:hypothetical protein